jgi:hypothetical protein
MTQLTSEQAQGELLIINSEIKDDSISEDKRDMLRDRRQQLLSLIENNKKQERIVQINRNKELVKVGKKLAVGMVLSWAWKKITT